MSRKLCAVPWRRNHSRNNAADKRGDMSGVEAALNSLRKTFEANKAKAPNPQPKMISSLPAKIVQLRIWPESVRGVPNSFLRSALFAAVQGKDRPYLKETFLGAAQGISVKFTGIQLDQSDLDVWEQAAHLARLHPLGNVCHFKGHAFLKAMGRGTGADDYKRLDATFNLLTACAVQIRSGSRVFIGSPVHNCWRDERTREYKLVLDETIIALFRADDWTGVQFAERLALKGKPLAKWLHGFYSSHAKPHPMKIETLHALSGSTNKDMPGFKRRLKEAFADLKEATGIVARFDGDLVSVTREPSPAQRKHLARKASRKRAK